MGPSLLQRFFAGMAEDENQGGIAGKREPEFFLPVRQPDSAEEKNSNAQGDGEEAVSESDVNDMLSVDGHMTREKQKRNHKVACKSNKPPDQAGHQTKFPAFSKCVS